MALSPIPVLEKIGNFIYANLMGMPVFVIGDREVAEELLNARGKISASRPRNVLALELCVSFLTGKLAIDESFQDGLGRMEFSINLSRKDTLNRAVASTEGYNSRCRWIVSTVDRS